MPFSKDYLHSCNPSFLKSPAVVLVLLRLGVLNPFGPDYGNKITVRLGIKVNASKHQGGKRRDVCVERGIWGVGGTMGSGGVTLAIHVTAEIKT